MSVPSMKTWPSLGLRRPISVLRNTDLPVPEGPSMTEISPAGRVKVTSFQIVWLPNFFVRPSTTTSTPTDGPSLLPAACRLTPTQLPIPDRCDREHKLNEARHLRLRVPDR